MAETVGGAADFFTGRVAAGGARVWEQSVPKESSAAVLGFLLHGDSSSDAIRATAGGLAGVRGKRFAPLSRSSRISGAHARFVGAAAQARSHVDVVGH